jgi:uncharacterized protein
MILTSEYYPDKIEFMNEEQTYTAFVGETKFASGPLSAVLPQVKAMFHQTESAPLLIFEDQTGRQVDFDLRGTTAEVLARATPAPPRIGPGRPKLGVTSREVSLLPRHWEWLEQQPNGASAALRRLVEQARKHEPDKQRARLAMDAANRFLSAMAGNLPGYEEATRALYAANRVDFENLMQDWPRDIRAHAQRLVEEAFRPEPAPVVCEAANRQTKPSAPPIVRALVANSARNRDRKAVGRHFPPVTNVRLLTRAAP